MNIKKWPVYAILFIFTSLIIFQFQNCSKRFLSEAASEYEEQKFYSMADLNVIDIQQNQKVYDSGSALLTVFPFSKDSQKFTYQWKKNGEILKGETVKDLVVSQFNPSKAGEYSVVIKPVIEYNQKLKIPEQEIVVGKLEYLQKPLATIPVKIESISPGRRIKKDLPFYLKIEHSEYPRASVQWFKNETALTGQTRDMLVFEKATSSDEGIYYAEISNSLGIVKSNEILILVDTPEPEPLVRSTTGDLELAIGQTIIANIAALSTNPITYKWFKDGFPIPGQTGSELKILSAQNSDEGTYRVEASNGTGTAFKNFKITVVQDIFVKKELKNISNAAIGSNIKLETELEGDIDIIEWYKESTLIQGQNQPTLNFNNVQISDEATYRVIAKNNFGQVSQVAQVLVLRPPQITAAAAGTTQIYRTADSATNSTLSLEVRASGDALTYQWSFKPIEALQYTNIPGATAMVFTKAVTTLADEGTYCVTVTNPSGSVTSTVAVDIIAKPIITQGLVNLDLPKAGVPHKFTVTASGDVYSYEWFVGAESKSKEAAFLFDPATAGNFAIKVDVYDVFGYKVTSSAWAYVLNPPTLAAGISSNAYNLYEGPSCSFSLSIGATGDKLSYQWYKDNVAIAGAKSNIYSKTNCVSADSGTYKIIVNNPFVSSERSIQVIVYKMTAPVFTTKPPATVSAYEGNSQGFSATASGGGLITYQWFKDDLSLAGKTIPSLSLNDLKPSDAGVYKLTATNTAGTTSTSSTLTVLPVAIPVFNSTPFDQNRYVGDSISISTSASGSQVKYRFYKDNVLLNTANTATNYYIPSAVIADSGVYKIEAYNLSGAASVTMRLNVQSLLTPVINSTTITNISVQVGATVNFSVYATGGNLRYKWFKNNVEIPGQTFNNLNISTKATDAGTYKVEVSNTAGSVMSTTGTITFLPDTQPTASISSSSASGIIYAQDFFSISASGTGGNLTYKWYKDNILLEYSYMNFNLYVPGSTSTLRGAEVSDSGVYKFVASNSVGSASREFTLTVRPMTIPVIESMPATAAFSTGQSYTIYTTATGGAIRYRWFQNGVDLNHTNSFITAFTAGTYRVEATNSMGTTSRQCVVTVSP